jgi:hypothetical protein
MMQQLLLFPETLEASLLREVKELKESHKATRTSTEKVRKSQFAKIGELNKKFDDLCIRLDAIESGLCKMHFHAENACEIREMALR